MKLTKLLEEGKIRESKDLLLESLQDSSGEAFDEILDEELEASWDSQWELLKLIENTSEDLDLFVLWTLIRNGSYGSLIDFCHTLLDIKDSLSILNYNDVAERNLITLEMVEYMNSKLNGFSIEHESLLNIFHCLEQGGTIVPMDDTIYIKNK